MSEYFYGIIGKGHGLLADKRIIIMRKNGEWKSFENIQEADNFFQASASTPGDEAYFWEDGKWKQVSFFMGGEQSKVVKGFSVGEQPTTAVPEVIAPVTRKNFNANTFPVKMKKG